MIYSITTATKKITTLSKKIRIVQGGTSASKTISILLYLIHLAQTDPSSSPTLTSVISESIPHLKRGAIRDFKNIMQGHSYWKDKNWNATDSIYTFETGSQIEFFSADNPDKLRGGRRDRAFFNEANNIKFDAFEQVEVRTKEFVFCDYNPTNEFWLLTDVKGVRTDVDFVILTYKDNEALSPEIISSIEQRKNRKGWWSVYGLGQLGEVEGKIYKDWQIIDEIPKEAKLVRYGLDFGYSNDPTSIVAVYKWNDSFILDEITYLKGLSNKKIAEILLGEENSVLTVCDNENGEKSADEIRSYGVNIITAKKGKGSVAPGIAVVQEQKIFMTKRSANIIREYRNYLWETDKNGAILNVPEHDFSHCFSPDTLINTTLGKIRIEELIGKEGYLYSKDGRIEKFYDVRATRKNTEMVNIEFEDGQTLSITPDHLVLLPGGRWKEASLLCPSDLIQSDNANDIISWNHFYEVFRLKILQGIREWKKVVVSSISLVFEKRRDTKEFSCSPHRRQHGEQYNRKFNASTQGKAFKRTHDAGEKGEAKSLGWKDSAPRVEMAWISRGESVALVTWEEYLGRKKTYKERVRSLPRTIRNTCKSTIGQILRKQLQDESQTKKIKRITRGFCPVTYNLEVENTHCLSVCGIIAHNSMDSCRYALTNFLASSQSSGVHIIKPKWLGFNRR